MRTLKKERGDIFMLKCLLLIDYKGNDSSTMFNILSKKTEQNFTENIHFNLLSVPNMCELIADHLSNCDGLIISQIDEMIKNNHYDICVLAVNGTCSVMDFSSEIHNKILLTQSAHQQLINKRDEWKAKQFYRLIYLVDIRGKKSKEFFSKIHHITEGVSSKC